MKDRWSFTWPGGRLGIAMVLLALLPAMAVGWVAYRLAFDDIRAERLATVGRIAEARHAQLVMVLARANDRAAALLAHVAARCGGDVRLQRRCAADLLGSYLAAEGALGATLRGTGGVELSVGASAVRREEDWAFKYGQLAQLAGTSPAGHDRYFVAATDPPSELRLAVTYPASNLQPVFDHHAELGEAGETFLADGAGYFITRTAHPSAQGHEHPVSARPMQACLGGHSGETIDLDYRDAEIIHGFRPVPELGAGCIMAHADPAETVAPLVALSRRLAEVALVFVLPLILAALYAARRLAQTEASLRASNRKFQLLFDMANDGYHVLDMQGRIVEVNRTSHERLGYTKAEMVGQSIHRFNAPESAAKTDVRLADLGDKGHAVVEAAHLRRDGSVMPVEVNARVVELDGEKRIFAVVRDISERQRLDRSLRLTQFALDSASFTIAIMRVRDGRFIYVNDAACRNFGHTREQLLGMTMFEVDPEFSPARWAELNAGLKKGGSLTLETTHRSRDGRTYPVEVTASVLGVAGEEYHVGFAQDITLRKEARESLLQSKANLRATLDNLPYRTWLKDTESRYIIVNKAYADFLGLKDFGEAVGKTDFELHPAAVAEQYRADDLQVMETRRQKNAEVQATENGEMRWLETFKTPIISQEGHLLGTVGFARDVTERKARDEEFRLMLQGSLDGVVITDLRGQMVAVNEAYCRLVGYSQPELLRMEIADIEAAEQPRDVARRMQKLVQAGSDRFETRHRAKDGRILDIEVSVTYSALYGGRLYSFLRDITERKAAERALRESAERLQSHINNSPMAVVSWDDLYRVTQWSAEAERMFGWSAAETLGKPLLDLHLVPEEDIPMVQDTMARLADPASRYVVSANRNVTRDGRLIECVWYNTVLSKDDGTMGSIMSQVLEVTEQKRAERELKESEQRFRTLAAATHEGVAITAEGKFVDANEQLTRMLGYERHELIGQPVANLIAPEDRERVMANIRAQREGRQEHAMLRRDGSRIIVEAHGQTIRRDGVPLRLTAIRDTTQQRQAEAALRAAIGEAERANNAKSRFLAAASHDLRQPLTALKLYVGVLQSKLDARDRNLLMSMQDCIGGLGNLLSKLLDLSKLDAGVVTPQVRSFDLDDLLGKVVAAHAPEADAKGLDLRCGSVGLVARTDPVLLQRIVGNFVANAIRYTEHGGVLIGCRRRDGKTWVEVWDTGVGVPPDKTGEIFEEFKQLGDPARTYGSGLGLTIAARTASLLGLAMRVQSRPGRGSLFAIELPLGRRSLAAPPPRPGSRFQPARIAVVDDNAIVLDALACGLESAGHAVVSATSRDELLARLEAQAPDILICDYRLAGGDTGFDVVSSVRTAFGTDLPTIIITGDTDARLMRSMAGKGMVILHKPVELEDLQERIEEVMAGPGRA